MPSLGARWSRHVLTTWAAFIGFTGRTGTPEGMRVTPLLLALLLLTLPAGVRAQARPWIVGVVVSSSGTYADVGRPQAFAAERSAAALTVRGIFGTPLLVEVRDDGGDPRRAEALADELAEAGAVAVLCCTTPAATARVAETLHARMTPHLALAEADLGGRFWSFAPCARRSCPPDGDRRRRRPPGQGESGPDDARHPLRQRQRGRARAGPWPTPGDLWRARLGIRRSPTCSRRRRSGSRPASPVR
jgi:hypothetical protein